MASCMRARTASLLSTSRTPRGLRLYKHSRLRFAQPSSPPDTLNPMTVFPSLSSPPLTAHPRQIRRVRTSRLYLTPNFSLDTSPHLHPRHTQLHDSKIFPVSRTEHDSHDLLASLSKTFLPLSIYFMCDTRALGRSGFPQRLVFRTHFPFLVGDSVHLTFLPLMPSQVEESSSSFHTLMVPLFFVHT